MDTFLKQHLETCLEDFRRACREGKPFSERKMYLARLDAALYHGDKNILAHHDVMKIEYGEG